MPCHLRCRRARSRCARGRSRRAPTTACRTPLGAFGALSAAAFRTLMRSHGPPRAHLATCLATRRSPRRARPNSTGSIAHRTARLRPSGERVRRCITTRRSDLSARGRRRRAVAAWSARQPHGARGGPHRGRRDRVRASPARPAPSRFRRLADARPGGRATGRPTVRSRRGPVPHRRRFGDEVGRRGLWRLAAARATVVGSGVGTVVGNGVGTAVSRGNSRKNT